MNCTNFAIFCEQCPWSPSIQKLLLTSTGIQHCSTMLNPTNQAAKQSSNRCVDVGFRFFLCLSHSKISILSHSKSIYIQYIYIYIILFLLLFMLLLVVVVLFFCVFFVCYKRKLVSLDVAAGMLLMMFQSYVC